MALRFFGRSTASTVPPQDPKLAVQAAPATAAHRDTYMPGDAMPLPEVEEKNTDSIWAAWTDAVNQKEEPVQEPTELLPNFLQSTDVERPLAAAAQAPERDDEPAGDPAFPATVIMDLPEMLPGRE